MKNKRVVLGLLVAEVIAAQMPANASRPDEAPPYVVTAADGLTAVELPCPDCLIDIEMLEWRGRDGHLLDDSNPILAVVSDPETTTVWFDRRPQGRPSAFTVRARLGRRTAKETWLVETTKFFGSKGTEVSWPDYFCEASPSHCSVDANGARELSLEIQEPVRIEDAEVSR